MRRIRSASAVAVGCGIVAIANLALLGSAAWNRRGDPVVELRLTERELAVPESRQQEDSAVHLTLRLTHEAPGSLRRAARWRHHDLPPVAYRWLDREKLRELGFPVDLDPGDPEAEVHYRFAMLRRAFVVVEQDGPAWRSWMDGREKDVERLRQAVVEGNAGPAELADAEALLELDRTTRSRLFPVDAGTDAGALRRRYPEGGGHAVLTALFRPGIVRPVDGEPYLTGRIVDLAVRRVHAPRRVRRELDAFLPRETWEEMERRERERARDGWPDPAPARYEAVLALGRRHEPWLVRVAAFE